MRRGPALLALVILGAALGRPPALEAAARKPAATKTPAKSAKKKPKPVRKKTVPARSPAKRKVAPTPVPTPTPPQFLRAAGACLDYHPGQFIVLAEPGGQGRAIQIDAATELTITPERGSRVRVLYKEGPEGPIAKKILAGPEEKPPPGH